MNAQQYAALEAAVQQWLDNTAGVDDLPMVIGNRTVELMATAARSVFDACEESQEYGHREGLLFSEKATA